MFIQKRFNTFFVRLRINKKDYLKSLKTGNRKLANHLALKIKLKYEELRMTTDELYFITKKLDEYVKEQTANLDKIYDREHLLTAGAWDEIDISHYEEDDTGYGADRYYSGKTKAFNILDEGYKDLGVTLFEAVREIRKILSTRRDRINLDRLDMILTENQIEHLTPSFKQKLNVTRYENRSSDDYELINEDDELLIKLETLKAQKKILESDCERANIDPSGITPDKAALVFSVMAKKWFDNRVKQGVWKDKGVKAMNMLSATLYVMKDKPLNRYTFDDIEDFRDTLLLTPINRNKYTFFKGLTPRQLIEANKIHKKPTFAIGSVRKIVEQLYSIFDYGHKRGYCKINPVVLKDLTNYAATDKGNKLRDAFNQTDLKRFYTHYEFISKARDKDMLEKPIWIWLPVIAMFNGLRITEICQLEVSDIVLKNNETYCFDINDNNFATTHKRLKNSNARRVVPIHNFIIECGFLRFVEFQRQKGETRLFSELKLTDLVKTKGWGEYPIKQMSKFIRKYITLDTRKVFHSTRHAFITQLIARYPNFFIVNQSLVGHANQSVTMQSYNETAFWNISKEIVDSVDYDQLQNELHDFKAVMNNFYFNTIGAGLD